MTFACFSFLPSFRLEWGGGGMERTGVGQGRHVDLKTWKECRAVFVFHLSADSFLPLGSARLRSDAGRGLLKNSAALKSLTCHQTCHISQEVHWATAVKTDQSPPLVKDTDELYPEEQSFLWWQAINTGILHFQWTPRGTVIDYQLRYWINTSYVHKVGSREHLNWIKMGHVL